MTAEREGLAEIAGVLAEHHGMPIVCSCGEMTETRDLHDLHLADALADLLAARDRRVRAEVWTEGFDRGFYDPLAGHGATGRDASESAARNPYEAER